jgi:hypothetical protein
VSEASAHTSPLDAFLLGLDIEEIYMVFAEGFQLAGRGLGPAHYAVIERKVERVRELLLGFGCPASLIGRVGDAAFKVRRADDDANLDIDAFAAETFRARDELSDLMLDVRRHLASGDALLYDLGVMFARLHLCVRVLASGNAPRDLRKLYGKELERVFPIVVQFIEEADAEGVLDRAATDPFERQLHSLPETLPPWDGGSSRWCEEVRERLDHLFGTAGITARDPASGAAVRPTAALPPAFVVGACVEEIAFLMAGWALAPDDVPAIARPVRVARDVLPSLGATTAPLAWFEGVVSSLARARPDAADIHRAAADIAELMEEVRASLTPDDRQLHDLGAMTVRVQCGLRIAQATAAAAQEREPGSAPGARLEPELAEFTQRVTEAEVSRVLERAASAEFVDRFYRLRDHIVAWDGGSEAWCRAVGEAFDRFLGEPTPPQQGPRPTWWRGRRRG